MTPSGRFEANSNSCKEQRSQSENLRPTLPSSRFRRRSAAESVIEILNVPVDRWQLRSTLLQFGNSQVLLCDRTISGAKEFTIIERFKPNSPYAQANGNARVLLMAPPPVLLVQQYAEDAQKTLNLMATDLLAKGYRIVWERFANTSLVRVLKAISEKCLEAISLDQCTHKCQDNSPNATNHFSPSVSA